MSVAPTPSEIFHRAVEEGDRGLDQSLLELVATSFIAGSAAFGIVALALVHASIEPRSERWPTSPGRSPSASGWCS